MSGGTVGPLAPETVVELRGPEGAFRRLECTPSQLEELVVGWLLCEGYLRPGASGRVQIDDSVEPARILFSPSDPAKLNYPERWNAAGIPSSPSPVVVETLERPERMRELFELMFQRAELRAESGGIHTGAIVAEGGIAHVAEDVSRHCVFDKLVGAAALSGIDLADSVLLLTGRISAAIARKAVQVGTRAVVTISIPTTLAASIAAEGGVILVGRARSARPFVYLPQ